MCRQWFQFLFLLLLASIAVPRPVFAEDAEKLPPLTAPITKINPKILLPCVQFTDFGTVTAKIMNSCDAPHTAHVTTFSGGRKVLERVFHLNAKETRPIQFPGDYQVIDWEKGWTSDGPDDGAPWLVLTKRTLSGQILWEVRNASSKIIAFQYGIYSNGIKIALSYHALASGQTDRLFAFSPSENGYLFLEWARVDPD
jgi:hypothetical protein